MSFLHTNERTHTLAPCSSVCIECVDWCGRRRVKGEPTYTHITYFIMLEMWGIDCSYECAPTCLCRTFLGQTHRQKCVTKAHNIRTRSSMCMPFFSVKYMHAVPYSWKRAMRIHLGILCFRVLFFFFLFFSFFFHFFFLATFILFSFRLLGCVRMVAPRAV